ncbi:HD domain-containing protein [bacterium]|nr:HD domain-containing protein [bacterium]
MDLKNFITEILNEIAESNFSDLLNRINEFKNKNKDYTAACYTLIGLMNYIQKNYEAALSIINDAKILIEYNPEIISKITYETIVGYINCAEMNDDVYSIHYNCARHYADISKNNDFLNQLENLIKKLPCENTKNGDPLSALVTIGQAVAADKNIDSLLKTIAEETKIAIQADRCTVFLYDKSKNELWSKVALGLGSKEIRFPADKGLAGHVVTTGETINIKDAYEDDRFNKEIDLQTGYRTKSILCMPIKNQKQEIVGAFQVLNKLNGYFTKEDEDILVAIGSSAGISLENAKLFEEQKVLLEEQKVVFDSFIKTLAASIDARDKITAGHSTRVRMYAVLIAEAMNFSDKDVEIIKKAAILHDIGKIGIRDSVLQKEGKLTPEEYKHIQEHVEITHNILEKIHMSEEFRLVTEIACSHHEKVDGTGYYRHLKGEEIHIGGRILAVADVFDAITSKRHYRDKMPIFKVIDILISDSGTHFDKNIVDKFLSIPLDKIVNVFLTENHLILEENDRQILSESTLLDIYNTYKENQISSLTELFNKYYIGVKDE